MDSDETITQEEARELVALLERARDLLHEACAGHGAVDRDSWFDAEQTWQRDVKALLDN